MKFKKITGGNEEDAYRDFPWLKNAEFISAEIDITNTYLIWESGVWKYGVWEGG